MSHDFIVAVPPQRFVTVHFHIYKNGGSTVESILKRQFDRDFATVHGPLADSTLTGSDLAEFLGRNPGLRAISSHHLRYPLPVIPGVVLFDCCFLRHPLARLHSVHSQLRRSGDDDLLTRVAREESPRNFLRMLIDHAPHLVNNVQVTQLANAGEFRRPCDKRDLKRASRIVRQMAIPGVVEMFDESLLAAEYFLQPAFPDLSLEYVRRNVSDFQESQASAEAALRGIWGKNLFEELRHMNQFDLDLFQIAQEEVMRRSALVPRFNRKLEEFRERCAQYHLKLLEEEALADAAADQDAVAAG
jgi:hypothetical protein